MDFLIIGNHLITYQYDNGQSLRKLWSKFVVNTLTSLGVIIFGIFSIVGIYAENFLYNIVASALIITNVHLDRIDCNDKFMFAMYVLMKRDEKLYDDFILLCNKTFVENSNSIWVFDVYSTKVFMEFAESIDERIRYCPYNEFIEKIKDMIDNDLYLFIQLHKL